MTKEKAKRILDYLIQKNMGFIFLESGELVDREFLQNIINKGV